MLVTGAGVFVKTSTASASEMIDLAPVTVDMTKAQINEFNGLDSLSKLEYVGVDTSYATATSYSAYDYETYYEYYGTPYSAFMNDVLYEMLRK